MLVANQLSRGHDRRCKPGPKNKIIQTSFKQFDEFVTCRCLRVLRFLEKPLKLRLGQPVIHPQFLLLNQLQAVIRLAAGTLAVLTRRVVALSEGFSGKSREFNSQGKRRSEAVWQIA